VIRFADWQREVGMRAKVHVSLKAGVLDPQGKAVGDALSRLGFPEVDSVRCGKTIELELKDGLSRTDAEKRVKEMCEKLLANTVVERYSIEIQ
jgi:phosphoribosylformylglycinamidine synthase PurS subunit